MTTTHTTASPEVRPTVYSATAPHPDAGPCPSWCWVARTGETHEVEVRLGGEVEHASDPLRVRASLHGGVRASLHGGRLSDGETEFASVEPHLETIGTAAPAIVVALRHYTYPGPEHHYGDVLRLAVTDAEELAQVLAYLVQQAKGS